MLVEAFVKRKELRKNHQVSPNSEKHCSTVRAFSIEVYIYIGNSEMHQ
ncbi:hypothetical protein FTV88_2821 [Heliorestis convoluta]|uniref:Uncharacterized protein n=1 Tax=Heliorestis convoluta TaxID=356322 RepID=A0A5Q2N9G3_9FIRM|nr:hypothetical protein FTV88_2821 [Heliorestis convoluta]